jgi:arginase
MPTLLVPFHHDEPLDPADFPAVDEVLTAEPEGATVTARTGVVGAAVADWVAAHAADMPIVLSGDCSTPLALVAGLQRAGTDPAVVWADGHGDFNSPSTSPSGYIGGWTLAALVGDDEAGMGAPLGLRAVPEHRVLLLDGRDLDPEEGRRLEASAVRRAALKELPGVLPDGPLVLHVDFDVLDPSALAGLRFPAPGGATLAELATAVRAVAATGRLVGVSLAQTTAPGEQAARAITTTLLTELTGGLRARLRRALPAAMKARDRDAVSALRAALAAIDNAEAVEAVATPPGAATPDVAGAVAFGEGEVPRRHLTEGDVIAIVALEAAERGATADEYDRLGKPDDAARLRREATTLQSHLGASDKNRPPVPEWG